MAQSQSLLTRAGAWRMLKWAAGGAVSSVVAWLVLLVLRDRRQRARFVEKNPKFKPFLENIGLLGLMPLVKENMHRLYDFKIELAQKMGPTFALPAPFFDPKIIMFSSDPKVVEYMLKTNFNNFIKGKKFIQVLGKPFLGHGIFAVDHGPFAKDKGEQWLFQRKVSSKIFTRGAFKGRMYDTFCDNSKILVNIIAKAGSSTPIDLEALFFKFTMDSIGSFGFGVDLKTLEASEPLPFMEAFDKSQKLVLTRFVRPGFSSIFGKLYPEERELYRHVDTMNKFSYKVIDDRLAEEDISEHGDILSNFVKSLRASGHLTENTSGKELEKIKVLLRDVVMSFFIAGRDTTAATLSFGLLLLCEHPEIQDELCAEIEKELKPDERATVAQLSDGFPLLNGVIQETLRLFPPVATDGKQACEDCYLPDGTFVPAGTQLNFEPYVMGRSTTLWGADAAAFKPSRWMGPNAVTPTVFEIPTFQPGPRQCLGKDLALFEAKFVVVELVRNFRFKLAREPRTPSYLPGLTITVNGKVPVFATPRTQSSHSLPVAQSTSF